MNKHPRIAYIAVWGCSILMQTCDITFQGRKVGTAEIHRSGLYDRFFCTCTLPMNGMYRLWAKCGQKKINLGICLPQGDLFVLTTQIPIRQIGDEVIGVYAQEKDSSVESKEISVKENEPFAYLEDLDKASLCPSNPTQIIFKD